MSIPNTTQIRKPVLVLGPIIGILVVSLVMGGYKLYKGRQALGSVELGTVTLSTASSTEAIAVATSSLTQVVIAGITQKTASTTGMYVASKTGKAYYLISCTAAARIAEKNKVWFGTKLEAEQAGYAPAKNCKEMK